MEQVLEKPKKRGNPYTKIVEKFLKSTKGINWSKEIAITKRLVNEFGLEFLTQCSPPYKTHSMVVCSTEVYKKSLKINKETWEKVKFYTDDFIEQDPKNKIVIEKDLEISNPIKNLADFLK